MTKGKSVGGKSSRSNRQGNGMQLIDLERHKELFGGEKGVAAFVAVLVERFRSPGDVYLCVGEQVLARVTSRMDPRTACQARVAARLAGDPALLEKLKSLIEADDFQEEGTFALDGDDDGS